MRIKLAIAAVAGAVSVSFAVPQAGSYVVFSERGEGWVRVEAANHVEGPCQVAVRFVPRAPSAMYWVWFVAERR